MTTTTELRASEHAHWELAFVIDGIPEMFVSHEDLLGIDSGDDRVPTAGLVREGLKRRFAVDLRTGHFAPASTTIKIEDHDGALAALFATDHESVEPLEVNVEPGDVPPAALWDKWVGHERIGPAGERHLFPVPFGFDVGLQHATLNEDADDAMEPMSAPPVSDVPVLWKGRRCALYRILRDHIGSTGWRPVDEWELIWWGTLEDAGEVSARVWSLRCAGVESWLRKPLGSLFQTKEVPVSFEVDYVKRSENAEAHEAGIAIVISTANEGTAGGAGGTLNGHYANVQWSSSFEFTADNVLDLKFELNAAVTNAYTAAGDDGAWSERPGCFLDMTVSDGSITFTKGDLVAQQAYCLIGMHKKLWGLLGFDIGTLQNDGSYSREGFRAWPVLGAVVEPPGDGYVMFKFVLGLEEGLITDDSGTPRPAETAVLQPDYKNGVVTLDPDMVKDGQVMLLGDAIISG
jgi:hypothetical protein